MTYKSAVSVRQLNLKTEKTACSCRELVILSSNQRELVMVASETLIRPLQTHIGRFLAALVRYRRATQVKPRLDIRQSDAQRGGRASVLDERVGLIP